MQSACICMASQHCNSVCQWRVCNTLLWPGRVWVWRDTPTVLFACGRLRGSGRKQSVCETDGRGLYWDCIGTGQARTGRATQLGQPRALLCWRSPLLSVPAVGYRQPPQGPAAPHVRQGGWDIYRPAQNILGLSLTVRSNKGHAGGSAAGQSCGCRSALFDRVQRGGVCVKLQLLE